MPPQAINRISRSIFSSHMRCIAIWDFYGYSKKLPPTYVLTGFMVRDLNGVVAV